MSIKTTTLKIRLTAALGALIMGGWAEAVSTFRDKDMARELATYVDRRRRDDPLISYETAAMELSNLAMKGLTGYDVINIEVEVKR
ncbi:MAG: hypothetical protein WC322_03295 [Candidatus Paceibacterota bacterium]|jgi:hypothetical protein